MARATFSIEDLKTPEGIERVLRQFELMLHASAGPPSLVVPKVTPLSDATAGVGDIASSGSSAVADVAVPEAPVVGVVYQQAENSTTKYHVIVGVDIPTSPAPVNWNFITQTRIQISSDSGFVFLNGAAIFDRTWSSPPPLITPFSTNYPGTYYIRGRVSNALGFSAWTTITLTTDRLDGLTDDTSLMAGPTVTSIVKSGATNNFLGGNEVQVTFEVPVTNSATYQGFTVLAHDSSTLPTATTVETGSAGAITSGVAVLTDASKAWAVNAYAGKDLVVFSDKRQAVPSYDYEGQIVMANIVSNTATTITFNAKSQVIDRTVTGVKYYVVNHGAGAHFWEKLKYCSGWITDVSLTGGPTLDQSGRVRSMRFPTGFNPIYTWVLLYNCYGAGLVTGSPPNATALGLLTVEFADLNITTTKIADDQITTPKILALNVTAAKIEAWTITAGMLSAGTVTAGTFIGTVFKTGSSNARVEIDSTNGIRAYDAAGTLGVQIPLSGNPGNILAKDIYSLLNQIGLNAGNSHYFINALLNSHSWEASSTSVMGLDTSALNLVAIPLKVSSTTVINSSGAHIMRGFGSLAAFKAAAAPNEICAYVDAGTKYLATYDGTTYFAAACAVV